MHTEKVTFPGSGGTPLAGRLDLPDAQPRAFALFAHCFTCSKDVLAASRIANALTGSVALGDRVAWLNDRPAGSQMARTSSSNASSSRRCAGPSVAIS